MGSQQRFHIAQVESWWLVRSFECEPLLCTGKDSAAVCTGSRCFEWCRYTHSESAGANAHPTNLPPGITTTNAKACIERKTTAPAPTKAWLPIVTPHRIVAFAPTV